MKWMQQEWASKGRMLTLRLAATAGVAEYEAMDSAREGLSTGGGRNSLWIAAMLIV